MTKNKKRNYRFNLTLFSTVLLVISLPLIVLSVKYVSTQTSSHAMDKYPYYFSQYNKNWQKPTCDIQSYGCYPTSLAMALKKFGVPQIDPITIARAIGSGCKNGTNTYEADQAMSYVKQKGLAIANITGEDYPGVVVKGKKSFNYERAKQIIDGGSVILLGGCMKYYHTYNKIKDTPGLHAVLVIDVNPKTHTLTMLDPTREWGPRYFNGDNDILNCPDKTNGYYFAYAITRP